MQVATLSSLDGAVMQDNTGLCETIASLTQLSDGTVRRWFETFRLQLPDDETVFDRIVDLDEALPGANL